MEDMNYTMKEMLSGEDIHNNEKTENEANSF